MKQPVTWRGHKDYAVVIDRTGKVRGMFDATSISQSKKLSELLQECLAEDPPAETSTSEIASATDLGQPTTAKN